MSVYGEGAFTDTDGVITVAWTPEDADHTFISREAVEGFLRTVNLGKELANLVNEIGSIDEAELATGSRDFGRGVAHALRAVNNIISNHDRDAT